MEKHYDILTALDCCVDLVLSGGDVIPRFGQQEQFVDDYLIEMGGSGCIFTAQTAKLGLCTAGIGVVGDDAFGRTVVLSTLSACGVDTSFVRCDGRWKTGLGVLLCVEGDRAILTYNGTIDAITADDVTDVILSQTRHLHISSYYLLHKLRPHWPKIAKRAKGFGATISLDTNWDPENRWGEELFELLPYVDVFLPNEQELMRIAGKDDIEEAAAFVVEKVPLLVIKLGAQGAMAMTRGQNWKRDAYNVKVADTVGAGDSFDGGFLWGWLQGMSMEQCLTAGCFCGTSNVTAHGGTRGQANKDTLINHIKSGG